MVSTHLIDVCDTNDEFCHNRTMLSVDPCFQCERTNSK